MTKNIVITGASSGFGAMTARALANAGHTVYAGMRDFTGHNARAAASCMLSGNILNAPRRPATTDPHLKENS